MTSPPRRAHHHGNLRAELLAAALAAVRAEGAAAFSLRDATTGAGVTSAAAYRHFGSRADVLDEVVVLGFELLARSMATRVEEAGMGRALLATGEAYVDFALEEAHLFALMFGPEGGSGRRRAHTSDLDVPSAADQVRRALAIHGHRSESGFLRAWGLAHGAAALATAGSITREEASRALADFADSEGQVVGSQQSAKR